MEKMDRDKIKYRDLEVSYGVENLRQVIEELVDNPDIPVHEMGMNMRKAVFMALLYETLGGNVNEINNIIEILLDKKRLKQALLKKRLLHKKPGNTNEVQRDVFRKISDVLDDWEKLR